MTTEYDQQFLRSMAHALRHLATRIEDGAILDVQFDFKLGSEMVLHNGRPEIRHSGSDTATITFRGDLSNSLASVLLVNKLEQSKRIEP